MKKLLLLPVWVVQLATQTKSFTRNPIIGSAILNRLGLHVIRLVLAHAIMRSRMWLFSFSVDPIVRKQFYRNGYILIPDFLPADEFQALKHEIHAADGEVRECTQGDTLTHRILLDNQTLSNMPACQSLLTDKLYRQLHRFTAGKATPPVSYIQTIKNQYADGAPDPQKNLHADTFHPTMKSWYFTDDVDERNGPFTYVPGSQRLTLARLRWEYKKSIAVSSDADRYSANGSFRISESDATEMNLQPAEAFKVPANTLVIANTHGFHCRGHATERSTRTELWTISRNNPFNPLPGIDHPLATDLQNRLLSLWRKYCDKRAADRGGVSSWHVIESRNTIR